MQTFANISLRFSRFCKVLIVILSYKIFFLIGKSYSKLPYFKDSMIEPESDYFDKLYDSISKYQLWLPINWASYVRIS